MCVLHSGDAMCNCMFIWHSRDVITFIYIASSKLTSNTINSHALNMIRGSCRRTLRIVAPNDVFCTFQLLLLLMLLLLLQSVARDEMLEQLNDDDVNQHVRHWSPRCTQACSLYLQWLYYRWPDRRQAPPWRCCSYSCWNGCRLDGSPGASSLNTDSIARWQLWLTTALTTSSCQRQ